MCYQGGSGGDNKSFFQRRRRGRSSQGGSEATSSQDHHRGRCLHRKKSSRGVDCSATPWRMISYNRNGGTTNTGQDVMWRVWYQKINIS